MKYLRLEVSNEQRANLETLYTHLGKVQPEQFDMWDFLSVLTDEGYRDSVALREVLKAEAEGKTICGTVACMVGSGPAAGIEAKYGEGWWSYTARVFGADDSCEGEPPSRLWNWLFNSEWANVDNTPAGGCLRLRIALDFGIPENAFLQMRGHAPLCYSVETP